MSTLDDRLAAARARIRRLSPHEAVTAVANGALLVDIRGDLERARDGVVPGAVHLPRTVLEWRLEPDGAWRNPHVGPPDRPIVLLCDHGYSSSFAAAALLELGLDAGDVVGGFAAWRDAGLPVAPGPPAERAAAELAGMRGPDQRPVA